MLRNLKKAIEGFTVMREATIRILTRVMCGAALVVLMLREYIFGSGLYLYRDRSWPLSTAIFPQAVFSPNGIANVTPDPFGFSRIFLTWPILIANQFSTDVVVSEKIFIIYLVSIFLVLAFALAQVCLRLINKASHRKLSFWRGELFSLVLVVLMFANFWSIQQLSGFYFTYVIEFLLLVTGIALILLRGATYDSILITGAFLSLSIFLDPNLFLHELVALTVIILSVSFLKSFSTRSCLSALSKIAGLLLVCLPALLTTLYILQQTTGTQVRPPGHYQVTSENLSLANALRLLGYHWSLLAYAPPSILTAGSSLNSLGTTGSPPFMIFPEGWITLFWVVTTWSLPVFSFSALLVSRFRGITIPSCFVAVIGVLMTQPSTFPFPYEIVTALATTPVIGGALATQYALPDHILIIVAAAYVLMSAVSLHFLLSIEFDKIRWFHFPSRISKYSPPRTRSIAHLLVVGIALSLLIFPSWQLFSGSFFPAGYTDGLPGNGIPNTGTFTPSVPPKQMFGAYQWLMSQPGNFNIYWPGAEGSSYPWSAKSTPSVTWVDSPRPSYVTTTTPSLIFPVGLRYLIANASSYDLSDYLRALNIRYLVLQPTSKPAIETSWGVSNMTVVGNKLGNAEGITLAAQFGDISVYEVSGLWGETYSPDIVASIVPGDETYTLAYRILGSLGSLSAMVPSSRSPKLCVDESNCNISIYSTEFIANRMSPNLVFNSPTDKGGGTTITLAANSQVQMPSPWVPWTLTNWGSGNSMIYITGNTTRLNFPQRLTTLSLSYNGTVTNLNPGGITVPSGQSAMIRVGFWYKVNDASSVDLRLIVPTLTRDESFFADVASPQFPTSNEWTLATFNDTLPFGTRFFTPRIQATATGGSIDVANVHFEVRFLNNYPESPFGTSLGIANKSPFYIDRTGDSIYLQYSGEGSIALGNTNETLPFSPGLSWFATNNSNDEVLQVAGNVSIATLLVSDSPLSMRGPLGQEVAPTTNVSQGGLVVFARGFAPGYSLSDSSGRHSPIPTVDGMNLFQNVKPGSYIIDFSSLSPMIALYVLTLGFVLAIFVVSTHRGFFRRWHRYQRSDESENLPIDQPNPSQQMLPKNQVTSSEVRHPNQNREAHMV